MAIANAERNTDEVFIGVYLGSEITELELLLYTSSISGQDQEKSCSGKEPCGAINCYPADTSPV